MILWKFKMPTFWICFSHAYCKFELWHPDLKFLLKFSLLSGQQRFVLLTLWCAQVDIWKGVSTSNQRMQNKLMSYHCCHMTNSGSVSIPSVRHKMSYGSKEMNMTVNFPQGKLSVYICMFYCCICVCVCVCI